MDFSTTICALATPPFTGALSVVRVSGRQALNIVGRIFRTRTCSDLTQSEGYRAYFGTIVVPAGPRQQGKILDQVVVTVFRAPHSFTGEDSVEISCHGSVYIQNSLVQLLIDNGAVMAGPGEFTQRAFLNEKMDLTQVEAVADLISSQNEGSHQLALSQLRGNFSKELAQMRAQLLEIASLMELELDFSEEDVEFADRTRLRSLLDALYERISYLCDSFRTGNAIKNGVPVAIVGAVNAGKSTLLNALVGQERAIVSSIAGTTRDTVEDTVVMGGVSYRFIDTAGLRPLEKVEEGTQEQIELMGLERSLQALRDAAVIMLVLDVTHPETFDQSLTMIEGIDKEKIILVFNKIDCVCNSKVSWRNNNVAELCKTLKNIEISAKDKQGVPVLMHLVQRAFMEQTGAVGVEELPHVMTPKTDASPNSNPVGRPLFTETLLLTNTRHYQELRGALESIDRVRSGMDAQISTDLLTPDLRQALYHIGSITGAISNEEILGNIFSRFCIGK